MSSNSKNVQKLSDWMNRKRGDVSGRFWDFCELCDALSAEPKLTGKTRILERFMEKQFSPDNCDTYLLYKLLLCGEDNRVYNMKDKQMINLFSQIFNVEKRDMQDHLNDNGDVSETLKEYYEEEDLAVYRSRYSLKKVDEFLDRLTTVTKQDDQIKVLEEFIVKKVSGNELKYLARLIKHDLRINAGSKFLLRALHPDAHDAFVNSRDLQTVVRKAMGQAELTQSLNASFDIDAYLLSSQDGNDSDNEEGKTLSDKGKGKARLDDKKELSEDEDDLMDDDDLDDLIIPKKSNGVGDSSDGKRGVKRKFMDTELDEDDLNNELEELAGAERSLQQKAKAKRDTHKRGKISTSMKLMQPVKPMLARACRDYDDALKRTPNGFFIEIKYDGERIQVHKDGDQFKFFSRNLKPIMDYKVKDVESYIRKSTSANKVVLDGEILLIDTKTGEPLPFGTLGKHKKTQYKNAVVGIFFFDILLLEGKSLFDVPLDKRRKLLEKAVNVIPNRILVSEYVLCSGSTDDREALLADRMGTAIENGLEGLMLKDVKSTYEPNSRRWLKMKKDYLKGMADSADLVVLGAFYGTGSKGGTMSVFLMGCYDEATKVWKTVCKAGNGHDDKTLLKLNEEFKDNMRKIDRDFSAIPDWLICSREIVPDFVVIDPKKSQVWEVTGAEFSKSEKHSAAGISIRFPRVTRIRSDKDIEDATNLKELIALKKTSERKEKVPIASTVQKLKYEDVNEEDEDEDEVEVDDNEDNEQPPPSKKIKRVGSSSNGNRSDNKSNQLSKKSKPTKHMFDFDNDVDEDDVLSDSQEEPELTEQELKDQNSRIDPEILSQPNRDIIRKNLTYIYGAITDPIHKGENDKILAHFVDDRGSWSHRGMMGELVQTFGDDCKQIYLDCFDRRIDNKIGAAQLCPLLNTNKRGLTEHVWICNLIVQKYFKKNNTCPIHWDSMKSALKTLARYARRKKASVHLNKFHHSVSGLDSDRFELYVYQFLVQKGIRVYIYTRDRDDKEKVRVSKRNTKNYTQLPELQQQQQPASTVSQISAQSEPGNLKNDESNDDNSNDGNRDNNGPIMANVRAFITGYPSSENTFLSSIIESLGGIVQNTLNVLPSTKTTHVISDNIEDEGSSHAMQLGYDIISRTWVVDCQTRGMLLNEKKYHVLGDHNADNDGSDVSDNESPAQIDPSVSALLIDIFSDMHIYIDPKSDNVREIKRAIIAFDGAVASSLSGEVTCVVTDAASLNGLSEEIRRFLKNNPHVNVLSSRWIKECVSRRTMVNQCEFVIE